MIYESLKCPSGLYENVYWSSHLHPTTSPTFHNQKNGLDKGHQVADGGGDLELCYSRLPADTIFCGW